MKNWSAPPARICNKATPIMVITLRDVIGLYLSAKFMTTAVDANSVTLNQEDRLILVLILIMEACTYRKEHLVIPLRIKVVIIVVETNPPGIIMREDTSTKQDNHRSP